MGPVPAPAEELDAITPATASTTDAGPLEVLGLDRRCARVYAHLCVHGATKAGPIVAATRLGRGDVYRALAQLVERAYVVIAPTRPATYSAVDPDEVFARALAQSHARRAAIVDAAPVLASWWAQAAAARRSPTEAFRQHGGGAQIDAAARRMVERATRIVLLLDKRPPGDPRSGPLLAGTLRSALPARAELRAIDGPALREAPRPEQERREDAARSPCFLVVDEKEALFLDGAGPMAGRAEGGPRAMWTDSPTLVAMAVELHASLWARAMAGPRDPG